MRILSVVTMLFLLPISANLNSLVYQDNSKHFSIEFSTKWAKIGDEVIREKANSANNEYNTENYYDVGYKISGTPDMQFPYILIQTFQRHSITPKQLFKELSGNSLDEITGDMIENNYKGIMNSIEKNKPILDSKNNTIYISMTSEIAGFGKIKQVSGLIFGRDIYIAIHCYANNEDWQNYKDEFFTIIGSTKYDEGYSYTDGLVKKTNSEYNGIVKTSFMRGLSGMMGGAILALLAGIFIFIFYPPDRKFSYGKIDYSKIDIDTLKKKIATNFSVNERNNTGKTSLIMAVYQSNNLDNVKTLMEIGADANITDKRGRNAFMYACMSSERKEIIKYLRPHIRDLNQKDKDGRTALILASMENEPDIVRYLIDEGADISIKDNWRKRAYSYAKARGGMKRYQVLDDLKKKKL